MGYYQIGPGTKQSGRLWEHTARCIPFHCCHITLMHSEWRRRGYSGECYTQEESEETDINGIQQTCPTVCGPKAGSPYLVRAAFTLPEISPYFPSKHAHIVIMWPNAGKNIGPIIYLFIMYLLHFIQCINCIIFRERDTLFQKDNQVVTIVHIFLQEKLLSFS